MPLCFPSRDRKVVDPEGMRGGKELGDVGGGAVIIIYYVIKKFYFQEKKKEISLISCNNNKNDQS